MALSTLQSALLRHQRAIYTELRSALAEVTSQTSNMDLISFYGQMQYHLGWVDADFTPTQNNPGKLLRPTLLLLAYEASGAWGLTENTTGQDYLQRALPAAAAIELTHNFTLIHDDIEDGDIERRHRATMWKIWGIPQAINTGDGLFALARLTLWRVLRHGVEGEIAARLGEALDHACLVLSEGQHLDINFEARQQISVATYIDMISRKTGALMGCAARMGALLGTRDAQTIERLQGFGKAIGIAFQVRDDILGVWATKAELGKTSAGDIYRRKKSLPILHALEHATAEDQQTLYTLYQQENPLSEEQVQQVVAIMEHTQTREYCRNFLAQECRMAHIALENVPVPQAAIPMQALEDIKALVTFVEEIAK